MAKVRIEWARLGAPSSDIGAAADQPMALFGVAQVLNVGASAVAVSAPAIPPGEAGLEGVAYVRVRGLSGAVNAAWGDAPVASETAGWRVEAGGFALVPVKEGQAISLIEAADPPAALGLTPIKAVATDRFGVIAVAATAQDLMPANPDRNGWLIQNQSSANLFIRSKGVAGTITATSDNHSLLIPPGGYYEPPKTTPHALSIIGAMAGQAFFAEEW